MRVPDAAMSAGTRELATWSHSMRVAAGRPGVPISMVAELGLRMSGMAPEMARVGGSDRRQDYANASPTPMCNIPQHALEPIILSA